jgi:hypothetical protein
MRTRILKPGFFKNETLAELGSHAMLLYQGLWLLADRDGRLEDRPKRIRAEVFPYFADQNVNGLLESLAKAGFIKRYVVAGKGFISIPTWLKHQTPHHKEAPSEIPPNEGGIDACVNLESILNQDQAELEPSMDEESILNGAIKKPHSSISISVPVSVSIPVSIPVSDSVPVAAAEAAGEIVSSKFVLLSPDTDKPSVSVTQHKHKPVYPNGFQNYLTVFYAGGKLLSPDDENKAFRAWKKLPLAGQIAAGENAIEIVKDREPKYIPLPANHLRDKPWTRTGPGRMVPLPPKSAREANQLEAERLFDERRKTR